MGRLRTVDHSMLQRCPYQTSGGTYSAIVCYR
jgi:hypothetical protein